MEKQAVKDLIYGGVSELVNNDKLYRHSPIGQDYCKFTEEGKVALEEYMSQMAILLRRAEQASLDKRAKDLVIKGLKGEEV